MFRINKREFAIFQREFPKIFSCRQSSYQRCGAVVKMKLLRPQLPRSWLSWTRLLLQSCLFHNMALAPASVHFYSLIFSIFTVCLTSSGHSLICLGGMRCRFVMNAMVHSTIVSGESSTLGQGGQIAVVGARVKTVKYMTSSCSFNLGTTFLQHSFLYQLRPNPRPPALC